MGAIIKKVAVIGLYRSGSSAIAGVLHRLGVDMGGPFKAPYCEPDDLSAWLRIWWDEPRLREAVDRSERIAALSRWLHARQQMGSRTIGAKHPLLCLTGDDLLEAWGADTQFIWAYRSMEESIASLNKTRWWPNSERMQHYLWNKAASFFARTNHLKMTHNDLINDPKENVKQMISYIGLSPTRDQLNAAVRFIHPRILG
jgi:hypothetical protein